MKTVAIFNSRILPITQPFIATQTDALKAFKSVYVGLGVEIPSLPVPSNAVLLTPDRSIRSRAKIQWYKWTGISAAFHRTLKLAQPSLIHAHLTENGPYALSIAAALQVPVLLHMHGGVELFSDRVLAGQWYNYPYLIRRRTVWKSTAMFVAVSHYIRRKAIDAGFPEDKIRVLYNGIDRATFHPSDEPTDNDLIVYVGRLVEYKGAAYLLRAMQIIQQKRPSAKLVLIGEGVMRSSFERLAHSLGVRCQFLGHQHATVVRSWLQRARVFCAPSLTLPDGQSEAFGIVFIEAQSMGVPCVSFRNAGVEEAILHGETGLLAPERDYEALAQHLIRYMEDDAFWRVSRERGIERVRKYFDVNIQSRTLEDLYEEVIAGATSTESWHRQKTLTAVATHAPSQSASPYQMPELQKGRRRSN